MVKKEVWIWINVNKWKTPYRREITGIGYPETLELEILKSHQDVVLGNLLLVVLVEQGMDQVTS